MSDFLAILRRELDHLLHAIGNLHTDHGIHGYAPPVRGDERTTR
jgi:hypothetical protein